MISLLYVMLRIIVCTYGVSGKPVFYRSSDIYSNYTLERLSARNL